MVLTWGCGGKLPADTTLDTHISSLSPGESLILNGLETMAHAFFGVNSGMRAAAPASGAEPAEKQLTRVFRHMLMAGCAIWGKRFARAAVAAPHNAGNA